MKDALEVTAAVIRRDGLVLIGKRRTGDFYGGFWEFPGGKIEDGENPEECLRRELTEELGIDCTVGSLLTDTFFQYPERSIRLYSFLVDSITGEPGALEHDEIRWVRPEELVSFTFVPADISIIDAVRKAVRT